MSIMSMLGYGDVEDHYGSRECSSGQTIVFEGEDRRREHNELLGHGNVSIEYEQRVEYLKQDHSPSIRSYHVCQSSRLQIRCSCTRSLLIGMPCSFGPILRVSFQCVQVSCRGSTNTLASHAGLAVWFCVSKMCSVRPQCSPNSLRSGCTPPEQAPVGSAIDA
jgi:hypothetical protein